MKVEVDTKHDSKEEIKHAIKLLMAAANMENKEVFSNEPEESSSANDLVNLFGDEPKKEESSSESSGSYVNLFAPNEETAPPVEETEQAQEAGNPLANFFGTSESSDGEPDGQTDPDDDDDNGFFKVYEDEEDTRKKPRISFY